FFFSSRRRHTRSKRDWSSDVCSSDLFQKAAVDADLAELVLDQHHLLPLEGFTDQLFDQGRLACAQKAGKNVDLGCHISNCLVFFSLYLWDNGVSPANFIHLYYNKPVNGRNSVLPNIL